MKLSKREKVMLRSLFFLVAGYLCLYFFILPEYTVRRHYTAELRALEVEKEEMEHSFVVYEQLSGESDRVAAEPVQTDFFFCSLDEAYIDRQIQSFAEAAGVELLAVAFTAQWTAGDELSSWEDLVMMKTVDIRIKGTEADIMELVELFYQEDHSVMVTGLNVMAPTDADEMEGSLTIQYYCLDEKTEEPK